MIVIQISTKLVIMHPMAAISASLYSGLIAVLWFIVMIKLDCSLLALVPIHGV
jgi:hypothetical protein